MEPAPKLFPVLLNMAVSIEDARAEDLGRFHIVAATVGKGDRGAIPAGVAQPDDVRLCGKAGIALSHAAGKSHTGADAIRRKFIFEVCFGRSDIAMAKANCIEGDDRSAGGEVHVTFGYVAFRLKVGHRYLVALDVTLSLGFSFSLADLAVVGGLAREPGLRIKPVHFEEDLLAHCRFHTDGLEIEIGHVGIAPIILHTRREDDGHAPGVRYTGRLTGGHLDGQFVSSLVRDSLD